MVLVRSRSALSKNILPTPRLLWAGALICRMLSGPTSALAIIGAGQRGLAAADILVRGGVKPVVFDRHPEVAVFKPSVSPNSSSSKNQ